MCPQVDDFLLELCQSCGGDPPEDEERNTMGYLAVLEGAEDGDAILHPDVARPIAQLILASQGCLLDGRRAPSSPSSPAAAAADGHQLVLPLQQQQKGLAMRWFEVLRDLLRAHCDRSMSNELPTRPYRDPLKGQVWGPGDFLLEVLRRCQISIAASLPHHPKP